jgi:hypothetical protein
MTPSALDQKIDLILCKVRPLRQPRNRPFGEYSPDIGCIDSGLPGVDSHEVGRRSRAAECEG